VEGRVLPEKLPEREMLAYYAGRLAAVEINNTFYRMPRREMLEGWAAQVPDEFRFVLKASRRITHFKRLKEASEDATFLLDQASALGPKLGAVLFQLPPTAKKEADRLRLFLEEVPARTHFAFEFRHESWHDDEVDSVLAEHNAARVFADVDDVDPPVLVPTADWGYLRLRRTEYPTGALEEWRAKVAATGWRQAYVFFKHEDDCAGPEMAARFLELA
jgi:uncharacterized protein YecE (DUF72 family)